MECFEHPAAAAAGLCKSCGKAVCRSCAIVFPKGLACSDACAKDAKELVEMNERGKKIYGIGEYKNNKLATGVKIWLLLSAVMWISFGFGYFSYRNVDYGSLVMAVGFSFVTAIIYRSSKNTGIKC